MRNKVTNHEGLKKAVPVVLRSVLSEVEKIESDKVEF